MHLKRRRLRVSCSLLSAEAPTASYPVKGLCGWLAKPIHYTSLAARECNDNFSPLLRVWRFKGCCCEQFCALPSFGYSSVFPTSTLSNVVSKSTTSICVPMQFGVNALTPKSLSGAAAGALSGIEYGIEAWVVLPVTTSVQLTTN